MIKEVIKAKRVDKIWADMAEDRGFEGRHLISDEDWSRLRVYLECAYEAGYHEGHEQGEEDERWYHSSLNGFDGREPDPKKKPTP